MAEFLINERSRALLDLVDAFKLSESELRDVWDGIFNRISEIAEIKRDEAWKEVDPFDDKGRLFKPVGFDDPMIYACDLCRGSGYVETRSSEEESECPKCNGSGVLKDKDDIDDIYDDGWRCEACKGTGYIDEICEDGLVEIECPICEGSGLSEEEETDKLPV